MYQVFTQISQARACTSSVSYCAVLDETNIHRGRTARCVLAVRKVGCFSPPVATGPRVLNSAPPILFSMDHACLCRWVVCRGVPGINNVIIGAVRALCENAPIEHWLELPGRGHPVSVTDHDCATGTMMASPAHQRSGVVHGGGASPPSLGTGQHRIWDCIGTGTQPVWDLSQPNPTPQPPTQHTLHTRHRLGLSDCMAE